VSQSAFGSSSTAGSCADEERAIFGDAAFGANLSGMLASVAAIGSDTNFDIDVVRIGLSLLSSTSKPGLVEEDFLSIIKSGAGEAEDLFCAPLCSRGTMMERAGSAASAGRDRAVLMRPSGQRRTGQTEFA
jgi:hypothetical protein